MSSRADQILEEALALAAEDRAEVGARLLESVDAERPDLVEDAWRQEIGERIAQIERGEVELEGWDEVREKAREALRRA